MNNYVVAVPSYKRAEIIGEQTLRTLDALSVDRDKVHVFVADEQERETYQAHIGDDWRIVVGVRGISSQRKFYHSYFPDETPIISLDDDIAQLLQKEDIELVECQYPLDEIARLAFSVCEKEGTKLWGINPVTNAFYMSDQITVGLRYICANFMGSYAGDWVFVDPQRRMTTTGEDHHSTLRAFTKYGSVVRIDYLTPKTKYFAKGGIDACVTEDGDTRFERHARQLERVASLYPNLASTYKKSGGRTNIRFKQITRNRYPRGTVI